MDSTQNYLCKFQNCKCHKVSSMSISIGVNERPENLPQGNSPDALFDNLIDRPTLASRMGISLSYVSKLVSEEELPYLKIGRTVRYEWTQVRSWLEQRKRP